MQGRSRVTIKIKDLQIERLRDTGVIVNVMSIWCYEKLINIELSNTEDTIRCANNSALKTKGKIETGVEMSGISRFESL